MVTHRGADISSKFIAPSVGSKYLQVLIISSSSWVARQRGNESTPASSFSKIDLPYITGMAPIGPIFPRPNTAEPSLMTATMFPLDV